MSVYYFNHKQTHNKGIKNMADISKIRVQGVEYNIKDLISRAADEAVAERVGELESAETVLDAVLEQIEL